MNCVEFERQLRAEKRDLGDGKLAIHAAECARCAGILSDERLVSGALSLLRASASGERAPGRVEQYLLAEFGARRRAAGSGGSWSGFRTSRVWLAAAALALLVAGAVVTRVASRPEAVAPARSAQSTTTVPASTAAPPTAMEAALPSTAASGRLESSSPSPAAGKGAAKPRAQRAAGALAPRSSPGGRGTGDQRGTTDGMEVTPFFATMLMSGNERTSDLQLVRVAVSRRTLEDFGLTTDPLQPDRPVKADLLIGPDGLTRAIRFVSEKR